MALHVFAGPTVSRREVAAVAPGAVCHPPVRHGDLLRLGLGPQDTALLVDGLYHHVEPVRHKEILEVMSTGTLVVGCSSMGALRAGELCGVGMVGVGEVFRMYRDGEVVGDDEVAVAHGEAPDYRQLSEPLVNMRYVLQAAVGASVLPPSAADDIIGRLKSLPYPHRTWRRLESMVPRGREILARIDHFLSTVPTARNIKHTDALRALRDVHSGALAAPPFTTDTQWRTRHLLRWTAQFAPEAGGAGPLEIFRCQQLYDASFPARWRAFRLSHIAGQTSGSSAALDQAALAAARRNGVAWETLSQDQKRHWLSPDELAGLDADECMLRLLVRSSPFDPAETAALRAPALPRNTRLLRDRVVRAKATNARFLAASRAHHVAHLREVSVRAHLLSVWRRCDRPFHGERLAAWDRGFRSPDEAVEQARPFFLHATTRNRAVAGLARLATGLA
ncbi:TfuA-like protein [Streptomyces albus subsp. chlorinus]|uniref:TfuA-like protein n=1 Tax=Streptomyces albus TaxID=1888 RepID=UPI0015708637